MKRYFELPFVRTLEKRLRSRKPLIQIIQGPRQVGKTTGVLQFLKKSRKTYHYCSADGLLENYNLWIEEQWQEAFLNKVYFFVIDEIQKIPNWAEVIKKIWDSQQIQSSRYIKFILLGSSSFLLDKGLSESLAGRYEKLEVYQWNFLESQGLLGIKKLSLEKYLELGGYPGIYSKLSNPEDAKNYIKQSIISPVIEKDLLFSSQIRKPGLFKQLFSILSNHPSQIISYSKLLGLMQEKGNTDLVKSYISFYEKAFLFSSIQKYNKNILSQIKSSPKNFPLAPCFCFLNNTNEELIPRAFEASVGAQLKRIQDGQLFYWNLNSHEVDFVLLMKGKLYAIEVKYGKIKNSKGLQKFIQKFPKAKPVFIKPDNYIHFLKDTRSFFEKI